MDGRSRPSGSNTTRRAPTAAPPRPSSREGTRAGCRPVARHGIQATSAACPVQRTATKPALPCGSTPAGPTGGGVTARPRLTAAVGRHLRRRPQRCADHTGKPVGWAVVRLDQRNVVGAQRSAHRRPRRSRAPRAARIRARRWPPIHPDQPRTCAIGNQCGVQHMVEVGVHRDDRFKPRHLCPGQAAVHARRRRRQLAGQTPSGPGGRRSRRSSARTTRRRAAASPHPATSPKAVYRAGRQEL